MKTIIAEKTNDKLLPNGRRPGVRGYTSAGARKAAIAQLAKRGFNYFVCYRDVQAEFALTYSVADWVGAGSVYVVR
jgi:hypothetical protein